MLIKSLSSECMSTYLYSSLKPQTIIVTAQLSNSSHSTLWHICIHMWCIQTDSFVDITRCFAADTNSQFPFLSTSAQRFCFLKNVDHGWLSMVRVYLKMQCF